MGTENQEKHVKVLALTDDDSLLHVVREAAAKRFSILHARELKQAVSFDALSKIGVLIADNELLMGQTENVIDRLKRRAPNMVVIIACKSDDGVKLMELVNTGKVFRVLTRPCQTGQTRLYMEAAAKRHQVLKTERESQSPSDGANLGRFKTPAMIGGAVAAVALSVALVVPFGSSESVSERLDGQMLSAGEVSQIELGLASAEVAFQAGRFFEPDDDNAVSHYQAVLEIRPAHLAAVQGLNRVANEMFVHAETALVDNRTREARKSVEAARSIRPEHTRLAFFDAMLTKEQQKRWQLQAEQAIAGGQFEVAFGVIAEAEMSGSGIPQPLMDTVIGGVMDRTQTAIADGRTADALDLMDRARVISADHVLLLEADQRLAEQAETLMSRAVVYAEASEFDRAESVLARAEAIPQGDAAKLKAIRDDVTAIQKESEEAEAVAEVEAAKPKQKTSQQKAREVQVSFFAALDDGRLVEPEGKSAGSYLRRIEDLVGQNAVWQECADAMAAELATMARGEIEGGAFDVAETWLEYANLLDIDSKEISETRASIEDRWAQHEGHKVIPTDQMTFVTYIAPEYPSRAVRRNVEGWVDVEFTVGENGTVIEVEVKDTERKGYFEKATMDAVSQWEFLPKEFRGRNIDQRVAARVQFNRD